MKLILLPKSYLFTIFLLTAICLPSFAQTILRGHVTDSKTGETLIGAAVHLENGAATINTSVKLDGTYTFNNMAAGNYKLHVTYVGYKTTKEYDVDVPADKATVLNIAMIDNTTAINEVAVIEYVSKATDYSARNTEKVSNNTMNVVSAQSIAISPDVLVSNVLGRVSGISIDRSNTGDAQHVIIRGMDKQYNTTLINGIKIPSPDNKNRYVPLDIFPAGLVDRIEVFKTLTPDMEGDASGGVVNLVMKTAPDRLKVDGEFGTGYSQIFFDRPLASFDHSTVNSKSPGEINPGGIATANDFPYQNLVTKTANATPNLNASLTIGNRYLNGKLGVLFSGSYQDLYQGANSFAVIQTNTVGPPVGSAQQNEETAFQSSYNRQYSTQLQRLGTIASIDYKFNSNNTVQLFASYLQLNQYRVRQTQDNTYGGYTYQGYRGTFQVDNLTETRTDKQDIYNITLNGKHKILKPLSLDWTIASSQATHKMPDDAEFDTQYSTADDPSTTTSANTSNPQEPTVSVAHNITTGPTYVQNESRVWSHNTDKDISAYLNLHYNARLFGRDITFSAGGMFRHKTRDNYNNSYSLPNTIVDGLPETYTTIPNARFLFIGADTVNAKGSSAHDPGVYTFTENIQGAYGMFKYYITDRLDVVAGVRTEHTYQTYLSQLPVTFPGKTATIDYTDYLPSINIKYALTNEQALRASYYISILRPAFADLIPFPDQTADEYYQHIGSPYLQHTVIDNYDLRYEFFPRVFDEFMAGGFYKHLVNPIETELQQASGGANLYLTPNNFGNATNYGLELEAKKYFGNIGASINYTYTKSQITTAKSIVLDNQVTHIDQTRPLQGQAANIGNASLLYKDQKNGIDAQLSLSYIGERIEAVSNYYGLDTWERPSTFLDFSAQKKLGKHFIVYAKANNLLNTPYELVIKQNNTYNYSGIAKYPHQESAAYTTVQYDQYYARYNLGVKYNF
ncbi:TonB-dependent receptor [Mucilaginibacter sp. dw_454]|uniref:TonB-dependent receptor n=1 Tax=Mucilaginibacter sp. dw_454 TaxID=2720079 RepID=UPI001BD39E50|nr:TonB-dependent receptor [Mucilaginibacter sp. dw_454]